MFGVFFFFQAEDGIRDLTVTGVQTCALPISLSQAMADSAARESGLADAERAYREALLLRPHDLGAKWNLELAVRRQHGGSSRSNPPSGGNGGGGPPSARGGGSGPGGPPSGARVP